MLTKFVKILLLSITLISYASFAKAEDTIKIATCNKTMLLCFS